MMRIKRKKLKESGETVPKQDNSPTLAPTTLDAKVRQGAKKSPIFSVECPAQYDSVLENRRAYSVSSQAKKGSLAQNQTTHLIRNDRRRENQKTWLISEVDRYIDGK
uniref:Uncharacterized protein n=1 Tax=Romanomermis culicivorax TaxID=13658 RepID=A0A915IX18_ROMCU